MMRRLLVAWCLLIGVLLLAQKSRAFWHSVPQNAIGGAVAYTGPIDINGTAFAFWSTRCGATAYTGNVIDVWDGATGSTTQTTITCSAGGTLNTGSPTALATTCAVSCKIKTFYDQSGSNSCAGAVACDLTQATNALRPTLNTSCLSSKVCAAFTAGLTMSTAAGVTLAQSFTVSSVVNRTGNTSAYNYILSGDSSSTALFFNNSANGVAMYAGAAVPIATANDNTTHAVQVLFNAASSSFYIDGSLTAASASPGASGFNGTDKFNMGSVSGLDLVGNLFEIGVWNTDKTANNSSMNSNQHTYWGF